jgi:hypothetical protein
LLFGGRRADDDDEVAAEEGVGRRRPSDASFASFRLIFAALIRRYGLSSSATAEAAEVVGGGGEGAISPCTHAATFSFSVLQLWRFAPLRLPPEQPTRSTGARATSKAQAEKSRDSQRSRAKPKNRNDPEATLLMPNQNAQNPAID